MSFCEKCGAYIPIGDTACPACGYDPEAEAKKAKEAADRRAKEEAERRYAEQRARWQQDPWQQTHTGGPAQGQYTSQRTGGAAQAQYASQRTGQTNANTGEYRQEKTYSAADSEMRQKAAESVERQKLSVLSYLGPFWLIPAITQNGDPFMKYHTEQGLGLLVFWAITSILGGLWGWVGLVGNIISLVGTIRGIKNVLRGKREPLPVIGDLVQSVKESMAKQKNKR